MASSYRVRDLVRVQYSSRWRIGIVRAIAQGVVDIEFISGELDRVWPHQVSVLRAHLESSGRRISLTRAGLCKALYDQPLARLHTTRSREIQKLLRTHGIGFEPEAWPSSRTRISLWPDRSVIVDRSGGQRTIPVRIADLLPRWLEPEKLPPGSRDPLGLQGYAQQLANAVLPGLTVFTSRAGYYGFLCWAIDLVNRDATTQPSALERLLRLERALVLSEFVMHGVGEDSCRVLGQRMKTQILGNADGNRLPLPPRILRNQSAAGAYRLYASSLISLGFAEEASELAAEGLIPYRLTDLGRDIANQFGRRVPTEFAAFALDAGTAERTAVRRWGERLCLTSVAQAAKYAELIRCGLFTGNTDDAQRRYLTVKLLFDEGLLDGDYNDLADEATDEAPAENEHVVHADDLIDVAGLSNERAFRHFYEAGMRPGAERLVAAAVYELLGLGFGAVFFALCAHLEQFGRVSVPSLAERIARVRPFVRYWTKSFAATQRQAPDAWQLVGAIFESRDAALNTRSTGAADACGAAGGLLLARVVGDGMVAATAQQLAPDNPVTMLLQDSFLAAPTIPMSHVLPHLIHRMVEHHTVVSVRKNRQRWCYSEGDEVVRDALQATTIGFHSYRFPQLYSLSADIQLQREALEYGA